MTRVMVRPAISGHRVFWPAIVCLLAIVPVARVFTYSKIFYVRDLSFFFWSRHLWLRHTIFGGSAPWWDPYVASGQSAIADALNQILMPLTLLVRLLPSDVVSFNLWVALPLPIAALGTYFFLRGSRSAAAAALGSATFTLAGVTVSMLNTPNLAWSIAGLPWVLWGVTGVTGDHGENTHHGGTGNAGVHGATPQISRAPATPPKAAPQEAIDRENTSRRLRRGSCFRGRFPPVTWRPNGPPVACARSIVRGLHTPCRLRGLRDSVVRISPWPPSPPFATLAAIFALQALSGEPVTCAATAAVAVAYAFVLPDADARAITVKDRLTAFARVFAGLASGASLAAAQLIPTIAAGLEAHRGELPVPDFWSLHPLATIEIVAPHLFGNYYDAFLADIPWMTVLNSGRDPFFYSIYLGPLVLLLAIAGIATAPRRGMFWGLSALIFAVAAMGGYTPFYPIARSLIPALAYFRFPVKYLAVSVFACAVLAANGWDALGRAGSGRSLARSAKGAAIAAVILAALVVLGKEAHQISWNAGYALAGRLKITNPHNAAEFLLRLAPYLIGRTAALLLAGAALLSIAASHGTRARAAAGLLWLAVCLDLAVTNVDLNLTSDISKHTPPAWYLRLASEQRVYIGGRVRGFMNTRDRDAAQSWKVPAEATAIEGRMELNAELPMAPSGWRVREALSYDLPVLWPRDYEETVRAFEHAGAPERAAFLRRSAVRWCVLPLSAGASPEIRDKGFGGGSRRSRDAGFGTKPVLAEVAHWEMGLVECDPSAERAFVTMSASFGSDPNWQRAALFHVASPDHELRLAADVPVVGAPGVPQNASARLVRDGVNEVIIEAGLPAEGYVMLRDSYDPSWRADVDGTRAQIARANGLYRAVKVSAGRHVIRFRYRPQELYVGLLLSGITACVLAGGWWRFQRKNSQRPSAGFTLIELMIVMALIAIVIALAFARYHNMQARGNEASALSSLRSIAAAEWSFAQTCGNQKYAPNLPALGQPVPSTGAAFLSPDLTSGEIVEKSGYQIRITAKPLEQAPAACNGSLVSDGYAATADPVKFGTSGDRYFAVNTERVLFQDSQTFTENMPETGAPGHGVEVK